MSRPDVESILPFRFHPEARAEAREAAIWYRERSAAAARGFATVLDDGIRSICAHPEAWPTWSGRDDIRRRVLRRYPYTCSTAARSSSSLLHTTSVDPVTGSHACDASRPHSRSSPT